MGGGRHPIVITSPSARPRLIVIPNDAKLQLTRDTDIARFGTIPSPCPLFGET